MTVDGSGFVDYTDPANQANIPDIAQQSSGKTVNYSYRPGGLKSHRYTEKTQPRVISTNLWGKNGFYMNGPEIDPFNHAASTQAQIESYAKTYNVGTTRLALDKFSKLVNQYGHTNSPGTLWSMAIGGVDSETDIGKSLLKADATASTNDYVNRAPSTANSPSTSQNPEDDSFGNNPVIQGAEFFSRNLFSLLNAPLQAIQGSLRSAGGALADESLSPIEKYAKSLMASTSLIMPTVGSFGDSIYGDNEFINPWEQTDFGQTVKAIGTDGLNAFTNMQAGLDLQKAKEELMKDPRYSAMVGSEEGMKQINAAATELAKQNGYYSEPGWFIDETSKIGEAQRRSTYAAWAIPGPDDQMTAWTLGRGIFGAVGGPEWSGYGIASGLVDMTAAIFMDPFTYLGPGAASKVAAAATGGRVLLGAEAKKAEAAYGITQTLMEKAGVSVEDALQMSKEELAQTVSANLAAHTVSEGNQRLASSMDLGKFQGWMRDKRRALQKIQRADRVEGTLDPLAGDRVQLWDDYLTASYRMNHQTGQMEFSPGDSLNWFNSIADDPMKRQLWTEVATNQPQTMRGTTRLEDETAYLGDLQALMGGDVAKSVVSSEKVADDTVRLYAADATTDTTTQWLKNHTFSGAVVADAPAKGVPVLSVFDGELSVTYWTAKRAARFVQADEVVPAAVRNGVMNRLTPMLDDPQFSHSLNVPSPVDPDSLVGQAYSMMREAVDAKTVVESLMANPQLTYRQLLETATRLGVEEYLGDALRTFRKNGFDGVAGLETRQGGRGVWMGDHPLLESHSLSQDAAQAGRDLRTLATPEELDNAVGNLDMAQFQISRSDLGALNRSELAALRSDMNGRASNVTASIDGYAQARITDASRIQQATASKLERIAESAQNTDNVLRDHLRWQMGMRHSTTNGVMLDAEGVRKMLFGIGWESNFVNRTITALSDFIPKADKDAVAAAGKYLADGVTMTDEYERVASKAIGSLRLVTDGWNASTLRAVVDNAIDGGGSDGLMGILSGRMGIDVTKGSVSRTLKVMEGDSKNYLRTWRTTSPTITRALGQLPATRKVSLDNPDDVADAIINYGRYAKVDEETLATQIGKVMLHADGVERIAYARNALAKTFNAISKSLLNEIDQSVVTKVLYRGVSGEARRHEIETAIKSSTRLWIGGESAESRRMTELRATDGAVGKLLSSDGLGIDMPNIQLETELAQGYVNLPSADEWKAALGRLSQATARLKSVQAVKDMSMRFFDNFFRSSMLAFRISYIVRNAAEMQVRMFLNGHQSVFSDPATMIGMTVGNFQKARSAVKYARAREQAFRDLREELGRDPHTYEVDERVEAPADVLGKMFAPYHDTVLGTAFEVGNDEKMAVANHTQGYYAITRLSHSLTDPRVYNNAVRQSWRPVAWGQPNFMKGWAHELIMLNRSEFAKLVLRGPKEGEYQTFQTAGLNEFENNVVRFIQGTSDEAEKLRALMVGADRNFAQVFGDEAALRDWLFTNPNSVLNRVRKFTAGNKQLEDFIANGELKYGISERFFMNSIPDADQRLSLLAGILNKHFDDGAWESHFNTENVYVPWIESIDQQNGISLMNKFFRISTKIERLGQVGPEFRMAYWDKIAELATSIRGKDVNRALSAARTTLSPIKRMNESGKFDNIGRNHPAFAALQKAKDEGFEGGLTLDEVHELAMDHAAGEITKLFYDASKRNLTWNALRLIFPFGQAWGNTMAKWAELGAKNPIQVYKALKAFNAVSQSGSTAIYKTGQSMGMYGQYAPGFAPWDQDVNGGFFYQDQYGDTSFMYPWLGQLSAGAMGLLANLKGTNVPETGLGMQSPATSLNIALGGDSLFPGVGPLAAFPLQSDLLPDWGIVDALRQIAMPYGEKDIVENAVPAWFAKVLGGIGAIPGIGDTLGDYVDVLAPANKNKNVRDAMMILSTSGDYPDWATNPETGRRLRDDAQGLSKALLLTTGLFQSAMPSTPYVMPAVSLPESKDSENMALNTVGVMNSLFQQYRERNGWDDTAARMEWVKDFGPSALYATTGDWKNLTRVPSSEALKVARKYPEMAKSYMDEFQLFFPGGDSSDVQATAWIRKYGVGDRVRKNKDEMYDEIVSFLGRVQKSRINSLEAEGVVNPEEADAMREDLDSRYLETSSAVGVTVDRTQEIDKLKRFVDKYDVVQQSQAGQGFAQAWALRSATLGKVRAQSGRADATLNGKTAKLVRNWYVDQIDAIEAQYPDFKLLASKFRKEFQ